MSTNNNPINAWSSLLAESVPFCPCPPEVSEHIPYTDKAETDGGILFPVSVSHEAHLVAFNNHLASNCYCPCVDCRLHDDLVSRSYPKNNEDFSLRSESYPINGCLQSLNLE